mmetsp:Transcript_33855/g.60489  ORF Transcript_33855/g.60489 Transcript_33855/m.60489 type:complete len:210 (-) Transcript_33855:224-853(-)
MHRLLHELAHVVQHPLLFLGLLLEIELRQRRLLLCRVNLVLLSDSDGIHPRVPAATHDVPQILIVLNLVRRHAHLTTTRNTLATLHKRRHRLALARQERFTVRVARRFGMMRQLWPYERILLLRLDPRCLRRLRSHPQLCQVRHQHGGLLLVQLIHRLIWFRFNDFLRAQLFIFHRRIQQRCVMEAILFTVVNMGCRDSLFIRWSVALW